MKRVAHFFTALSLVVAVQRPASGALPPPDERVPVATLEELVLSDAAFGRITEDVTAFVVEQRLKPTDITLTVVWVDREAMVHGFHVSVSTAQATLVDEGGDPLGPMTGECAGCSLDDLSAAAVEAVRVALVRYAEITRAPEPKRPPAPTRRDPPPPNTPDPQSAQEEPPPLGGLGWSGIGLLAVGGAGISGGAVLIALGRSRIPSEPAYFLDYRTPGYGVLGAGLGLAVLGGALLVADRIRAKRRRPSRVGVTLAPSFAGVVTRGRF